MKHITYSEDAIPMGKHSHNASLLFGNTGAINLP